MLVLAIGADSPGKQELDPEICASADLVVADSRAQCVERGEIQHAIAAGEMGELEQLPAVIGFVGQTLVLPGTTARLWCLFECVHSLVHNGGA